MNAYDLLIRRGYKPIDAKDINILLSVNLEPFKPEKQRRKVYHVRLTDEELIRLQSQFPELRFDRPGYAWKEKAET